MASLQDQLLKAGLIDKKKAKEANKEKRKQTNVARRSNEDVVDEVKVQAEKVRLEKLERDRELNRQRDEEIQQKAVAAQIRQLIQNHSQSREQGVDDNEYHFKDGKLIKKIRVSHQVQLQLVRGQLVLVRVDEDYALVPRVVAEKIAQRDETVLIPVIKTEQAPVEEDDPYKDYVIPDDLMW